MSHLVAKLRYMGRQYSAGQYARGGGSQKHYLEDAADQIEQLLEVERAARRYYERYCQDEADGSEWVCGEEQRRDAQALRDALRATVPTPAAPDDACELCGERYAAGHKEDCILHATARLAVPQDESHE